MHMVRRPCNNSDLPPAPSLKGRGLKSPTFRDRIDLTGVPTSEISEHIWILA